MVTAVGWNHFRGAPTWNADGALVAKRTKSGGTVLIFLLPHFSPEMETLSGYVW